MNTLFLTTIIPKILLFILFLYISRKWYKNYLNFKTLSLSSVSSADNTIKLFQGKLTNVQNDLLTPLSRAPCSYYKVRVMDGKRLILSLSSSTLFKLTDEFQSCIVSTAGTHWVCDNNKVWNGNPDGMSATTLTQFPSLGKLIQSKKAKQYIFLEEWIEPQSEVYVMAKLNKVTGKNNPFNVSKMMSQAGPIRQILFQMLLMVVGQAKLPNQHAEFQAWDNYAQSIAPQQEIIFGPASFISTQPLERIVPQIQKKMAFKTICIALIFLGWCLVSQIFLSEPSKDASQPWAHAQVNLPKLYTSPNKIYTVNYPSTWIFENMGHDAVKFIDPKGKSAMDVLITIEVFSRSEALPAGLHESETIIKTGSIELPHSVAHRQGGFFISTYQDKHVAIKRLQFIFPPLNAQDRVYRFSYSAPEAVFEQFSPIAQSMFDSWVAQ